MLQIGLSCCKEKKLYNQGLSRCKSIYIIQKSVSSLSHKLLNLPKFQNNRCELSYRSINSFEPSSRADNDSQNKLRESIIDAIVNNCIPETYYKYSRRWKTLYYSVQDYIQILNPHPIHSISCILKAGRKNHYDFDMIVNNIHSYQVEFKFNAETIGDTPQFASIMNPDRFLSDSFTEFFYHNHFVPIIAKSQNFSIPDKNTYMKEINSNDPECMKPYKRLYKLSPDFNKLCKRESKKSIEMFLSKVELNTQLLSTYLLETQKNKHYMMYSKKRFHYQKPNLDDYSIQSYIVDPKYKNRFICQTKSGKKMYVLLRWKNGNGVAFPAFQISSQRRKQISTD